MTPHADARRLLAATLVLALAAPPAAAQDADPLITLNVRDESVANIVHALAAQHRLSLVAGDQLAGKVSINLFDVPLGDALRQILATQGMTIVREGPFLRVMTLDQFREQQRAADAVGTRVFTLSHVGPAEAARLVQPLLSTDGQLSTSEATAGSAGATTNGGSAPQGGTGLRPSIVVRDRGSVLEQIATSLAQIDRPPPQVLLEATILSIDLGEDNRLGVDINVLGGIDFRSASPGTDLTGLAPYSTGGAQFDDSLISGQTFGFAGAPSAGLSFAYIQNNVAAFVEALERTTNATIVSNPRVIALNGEQAEIIVGGRLGYTTVTQNDTSTIETVQFLDTGTQLVFRPQVGEDGWIRMEVHPQNSSGVIDPVTGVPSESTTEITTRILMRDGQTLILGGLIGESVSTTREQIPLLGSLPLVGWLFGRTQEQVTRRELVILLTPHILDPVVAEREAATARERFAAVRRSHWDRLSPYIRPAIANRMLTDARVLQTTGELERALGAVEWALAMDVTNADAAVLRDELLEALALRNLPRDETGSALELLRSLPEAKDGGPK